MPEHTFHLALRPWLHTAGISEYIIIDWSSRDGNMMRSTLPNELVQLTPELRGSVLFLNVLDEEEWVLTRAYNLGFSLAHSDIILKVDCDSVLSADFLDRNRLDGADPIYRTGSMGTFRNENEVPLHGVLLAPRFSVLLSQRV